MSSNLSKKPLHQRKKRKSVSSSSSGSSSESSSDVAVAAVSSKKHNQREQIAPQKKSSTSLTLVPSKKIKKEETLSGSCSVSDASSTEERKSRPGSTKKKATLSDSKKKKSSSHATDDARSSSQDNERTNSVRDRPKKTTAVSDSKGDKVSVSKKPTPKKKLVNSDEEEVVEDTTEAALKAYKKERLLNDSDVSENKKQPSQLKKEVAHRPKTTDPVSKLNLDKKEAKPKELQQIEELIRAANIKDDEEGVMHKKSSTCKPDNSDLSYPISKKGQDLKFQFHLFRWLGKHCNDIMIGEFVKFNKAQLLAHNTMEILKLDLIQSVYNELNDYDNLPRDDQISENIPLRSANLLSDERKRRVYRALKLELLQSKNGKAKIAVPALMNALCQITGVYNSADEVKSRVTLETKTKQNVEELFKGQQGLFITVNPAGETCVLASRDVHSSIGVDGDGEHIPIRRIFERVNASKIEGNVAHDPALKGDNWLSDWPMLNALVSTVRNIAVKTSDLHHETLSEAKDIPSLPPPTYGIIRNAIKHVEEEKKCSNSMDCMILIKNLLKSFFETEATPTPAKSTGAKSSGAGKKTAKKTGSKKVKDEEDSQNNDEDEVVNSEKSESEEASSASSVKGRKKSKSPKRKRSDITPKKKAKVVDDDESEEEEEKEEKIAKTKTNGKVKLSKSSSRSRSPQPPPSSNKKPNKHNEIKKIVKPIRKEEEEEEESDASNGSEIDKMEVEEKPLARSKKPQKSRKVETSEEEEEEKKTKKKSSPAPPPSSTTSSPIVKHTQTDRSVSPAPIRKNEITAPASPSIALAATVNNKEPVKYDPIGERRKLAKLKEDSIKEKEQDHEFVVGGSGSGKENDEGETTYQTKKMTKEDSNTKDEVDDDVENVEADTEGDGERLNKFSSSFAKAKTDEADEADEDENPDFKSRIQYMENNNEDDS